jgi:branched-chain amino acid transport system permease protein
MVMLVASIGLFYVIQALIAILFTSQFQTLADSSVSQKIYQVGSAVLTQTQLIIIASSVLALLLLVGVLKYSLFGKAVNAISDDEEVAKIVGINTNKVISRVFVFGSIIAGLVGILNTYDTGTEPTVGLHLFIKGVIAAIIGGIGSVRGAFLGALILAFAENFGIWKISGEWKDIIAFGLLILFLLFRPQGIIKK